MKLMRLRVVSSTKAVIWFDLRMEDIRECLLVGTTKVNRRKENIQMNTIQPLSAQSVLKSCQLVIVFDLAISFNPVTFVCEVELEVKNASYIPLFLVSSSRIGRSD